MAIAVLAGCAGGLMPRATGKVAPALEVLSVDYERTTFANGAVVSGTVAVAQQRRRVATAAYGRIRNAALGPIPTEVRFELTRLVTRGNTVTMTGRVALRDLGLGTIMAERDDFSATGSMPLVPRGGSTDGLVFRGVEADVIAWLQTLECDTDTRRCGPRLVAAAETEGADLTLDDMVGPRGSGLRKINSGGIDPNQVIAAATAPVAAAPEAGQRLLGTTVAALGLLDRSGFWLQTPLVSQEAQGEVRDPATGKTLAVTLVPKAGPAGGGSQISLAALTALGLNMTALVTLEVRR